MLSDERLRARLSEVGTLGEHEPLARHTTIRLGGPARWLLSAADPEKLVALLAWLEGERVPWTVLGGGSNVVAPDEGFPGVVIRPVSATLHIAPDGGVVADAGVATALLARRTVAAGLAGLAWAAGLPGAVGGAVVGNAGCYGGEIRDGLAWVEAWSPQARAVRRYGPEACRFGYRDSAFKHESCCVLRAAWRLSPLPDPAAAALAIKAGLGHRRQEQPLGAASAGCLFKNVPVDAATIGRLEAVLGLVPEPARARGFVPAGWLLDRLGLKGFVSGGVRVSDRHANFAVCAATATARDMAVLRDELRTRVFAAVGLALEPEIRFLGRAGFLSDNPRPSVLP